MKKFSIILVFTLLLVSCGYQLQGYKTPINFSVLGDGSATIAIESVDQATMYTWVPYYVRQLTRDEVSLRKIGIWEDGNKADYLIRVRVPSFRVAAFDSNTDRPAIVSSVSTIVEYVIYDGKTGQVVWESGQVAYSENYENPREESAIQEVLQKAIGKVFDKLQIAF